MVSLLQAAEGTEAKATIVEVEHSIRVRQNDDIKSGSIGAKASLAYCCVVLTFKMTPDWLKLCASTSVFWLDSVYASEGIGDESATGSKCWPTRRKKSGSFALIPKAMGFFLSSISSLTEKELSSACRDVTTSCQKGVSMKDKMSFGQI